MIDATNSTRLYANAIKDFHNPERIQEVTFSYNGMFVFQIYFIAWQGPFLQDGRLIMFAFGRFNALNSIEEF